jgi:hypothetical protein
VSLRDIGNSDAVRQGQEDVTPSPRADGCAVCRGAGTSHQAGDAAEEWLMGQGDARPVHSTAQNPFEDVMVQCGLCGQGRASHAVGGGP